MRKMGDFSKICSNVAIENSMKMNCQWISVEGVFRRIIDHHRSMGDFDNETCLITRGYPKIASSNVENDEKPLGFRIVFVETFVCIHDMHKNTFIIKKTHCKKNNDTCTTGGSQPLSNQRKNKPMSKQRGYTWFQLDTLGSCNLSELGDPPF